MELWDVLDKSGNKTGRTAIRGAHMHQDEYHLIVEVWIVDSRARFLITQRSQEKQFFPLVWTATCGSAVSGDDSLTTALKETFEETGVELEPSNGVKIKRFIRDFADNPSFVDVWLFRQDIDLEKIVLQEGETCDVRLANEQEILSLLESNLFKTCAADDNALVKEIFEFYKAKEANEK